MPLFWVMSNVFIVLFCFLMILLFGVGYNSLNMMKMFISSNYSFDWCW